MRRMPVTAIVGGDKAAEALAFGLISPDLHSVLISGPTGTGKSVAARSVSGLVPDMRVTEVPAGTTVDQLVGDIDIEAAVSEGAVRRSESILDRADGGVIIADNINLLRPEVLHALMDAVECGTAEDGCGTGIVSCDTLLIATTDPDEGELDAHILDRFDICVYMEPCAFPEDRMKMVRRSLAYERGDAAATAPFDEAEAVMRECIASSDYGVVEVPEGFPGMISEISRSMNVEGHRGDIAVLNTLRASAAYEGREVATVDDLKRAVFLCLRHRRREPPQEQEETEPPEEPPDEPPEEPPDEPPEDDRDDDSREQDSDGDDDRDSGSGAWASGDGGAEGDTDGDASDSDDPSGGGSDRTFGIGEQFDVADYIPPESRRSRNRRSGRQDRSVSDDGSGRTVGYAVPRGRVRDVALVASIRAAAPYQLFREHNGLALAIRSEDLREKVRVRSKSTTVLFVVDGSGSMGAQNRMVAVKGAILSMLNDAYRRRDSVGLVVFKGDSAEVVLPPTRSVYTAYRALEELPTGGRTPLSEGLQTAYRVLERDAASGLEPVMVVLTDGRGNVKGGGYSSAEESLRRAAEVVSGSGIRTIVVDTEAGLVRFGKALDLAAMMDSTYILLEDLDARRLAESVRSVISLDGETRSRSRMDGGYYERQEEDTRDAVAEPSAYARAHKGPPGR